MPILFLLLQEPAGEAAQQFTPFSINTGMMFWTLLIFGLLLVVLWRFGYPALLRSVQEREARIAKQLADAERANAEAQRLLAEHREALAAARTEAQDIVGGAKVVAQKEREQLLEHTREEQERMLERARKEIGAERDKAILALRREAVDLSIAAASRLVEANLDTEANRRLVQEYLATIERQH
jgi:F-type H+-transporting ATPase subunit b